MAELTVPRLDFSPLARLPQVYQEAQTRAARSQTLAELGQGTGPLDYDMAARKLMAVGDREGALSLAQLGNNQRDFAFRQQEASRAQGNADRGFGLQERQINATAGNTAASQALARAQFDFTKEQGNRPDIRETKDANGNPTFVMIDRKNNSTVPLKMPGADAQPNNPFMTGGNMNEGQSNAALYASRAMEAERVLSQAGVGAAGGSLTERGRASIPIVGNFVASENYQKFDQARRDFTAAILRKESGAAIGRDEYANADKQYFPQPGDSPAVIQQKKQNRISAIRGIGAAAGPGYKPATALDPNGNVIDRPQAPGGSMNLTGSDKTITGVQVTDMPPLPPGFQLVK
jgi:hypothetical protein